MKGLTPFDSETLLMMEYVSGHTTKVEKRRTGFSVYMSIAGLDSAHKKAVAEAVEGRWGRRLVTLKMFNDRLSCKVAYAMDSDKLPSEIRGDYTSPSDDDAPLFRQCYTMVSNYDGDEQRIMRMMDVMFGRNLSERLAKLSEEYGELQEAAGNIAVRGYMSEEDKVNVVDEVSDMCAVLGHIVHILGFDFAEMLLRAEAKISGRIDNPDYMRRHPHTEDNN